MGQEIEDGRLLFLVLFLHALGLLVGDALVAVDAGLAVALRQLVLLPRALFLHLAVHALEAVAVAALARARALHALPLVLGQLQALGLELLRRVDGAHELAVEFLVAWIFLATLCTQSLGTWQSEQMARTPVRFW